EGFEGILPVGRDAESLARVDGYVGQLVNAVRYLGDLGLFDEVDEILLTAGGSAFPDRVAAAARPVLSRSLRVVVRSGGTVTHDHGDHSGVPPLAPEAEHSLGALRPALELWAAVVSTPEPGLALAAFGKRDAPYDARLPVVLGCRRDGQPVPVAGVEV